MKYKVDVQLKKEILDPEARAVEQSLRKVGFHSLKNITISKSFLLEVDEAGSSREQVENLVKNHLTNPLSENYVIHKLEQESGR